MDKGSSETGKRNSIPSCPNCSIKGGVSSHPSTYRLWSHDEEWLLLQKTLKSRNQGSLRRIFSSVMSSQDKLLQRHCTVTLNSRSSSSNQTCHNSHARGRLRWIGWRHCLPCTTSLKYQVSQSELRVETIPLWMICFGLLLQYSRLWEFIGAVSEEDNGHK